jgi:AICAR transformylase/IMP cyclohydrolase PurH
MKKIFLIIAAISAASVFGVVWEYDPSYTPEQREQARKHNERMAQRNRKIRAEKQKQLDALSQKYKEVVENVKKHHKDNSDFQEALAIAELKVIARYEPEVQKYLDEINAVREKHREIEG